MQKLYSSKWNPYQYRWEDDIENIITYIEGKQEKSMKESEIECGKNIQFMSFGKTN